MRRTMARGVLAGVVLAVLIGCGDGPEGGGGAAASKGQSVATAPATAPASPGGSPPPASRPSGGPASRPTTAQARQQARRITELVIRVDALHKEKKFAEALKVQEELVRTDPDSGVHLYNLACLQSLTGKLDEAVTSLEKSIEKGYAELRHMERDEDLAAIRSKPGYRRILARREEIQRQRAQAVQEGLKARLGEGYIYQIDHEHRLVYAANVDARTLGEIRSHLTGYAEAMRADLFTHNFELYVAVVVPREGVLTRPGVGGYYNHAQRTLLARSIGMVLTHEFTHALHAADQEALGQRHPIWIVEGLATLFETSEVRAGHAVPVHNHRLNLLQRLIASKGTVPLAEFLKFDQRQFMARAMGSYPEARYVLMYLHEKGLLKKWYDAYTASYADDPTGAATLEDVLGRKLPLIEADWLDWAKALKAPPLRIPPGHAYVGVSVAMGIDGLKVAMVARGSGAEAAGLRVGDVILRIDDKRMVDPEDLVLLVSAREVGEKVRIEYRRGGEDRAAEVLLKAMPEPATRPATRPATMPSTQPSTKPSTGPASAPAAGPATAPASRPASAPSIRPSRRPRPRPASAPAGGFTDPRPFALAPAETATVEQPSTSPRGTIRTALPQAHGEAL